MLELVTHLDRLPDLLAIRCDLITQAMIQKSLPHLRKVRIPANLVCDPRCMIKRRRMHQFKILIVLRV